MVATVKSTFILVAFEKSDTATAMEFIASSAAKRFVILILLALMALVSASANTFITLSVILAARIASFSSLHTTAPNRSA